MKFIDMNFNETDSKQGSELTGKYTNLCELLYFFVDNAITSKEPVDPKAIAKELPQELHGLLESIVTSDPSSQDKALVTALISKYKNLDQDPRDIAEFKEHTKNLIESNSFGLGTCNYYITRVTSGDVMGKMNAFKQENPAPTDAEMQPQEGQEQGPPQEGQEQGPPQEGQPQGGQEQGGQAPQNGQYSYMSPSMYDEWDNLYTDIQYNSEEDIKTLLEEEEIYDFYDDQKEEGFYKAKDFLRKNLKSEIMFSDEIEELDELFSDFDAEDEGFDLALAFLMKKNL